MDWWFALAIFLYFVSAALLIAEVFIPSGGLISVCALGCIIGGVAIFFKYSLIMGWVGTGVAAVMIPSVVIIAYRILPKTKFGKAVTLAPPKRQQGDAVPDTDQLKGLLGAEGTVLTPLRPVGMCDFAGQRIECVAESGYIDKDKSVKVINVQSSHVTVRIAEQQ